MHAPCDATLLRIFVGDDDTFDDRPLYDQIVLKARAMEMAGATVVAHWQPRLRSFKTIRAKYLLYR